MYLKILTRVILIIGLVSVQFAFINNLPWYFNNINLILTAIIFILALGSFKEALWWIIGAGLLVDIYSFNHFGLYSLGLLLVIAIINFLLVNFLTDRSLYSMLALISLACLFNRIILQVAKYFTGLLNQEEITIMFNLFFWKQELFGILLTLILAAIIFYFLNFITNRLKPVFLIKRRQ